ncbi:aldehyde dehydrogenase family protein [Pimelobacter simplex]|uniref:Aldehyde dehydrogenase n=1 Tax=Nocardioides simplex TaxID=2045 RepID=A0A0A1DU83_NOCSI|nr:aldehyde dehydrogenase [Pimelobacter simplex]AIY20118.2 Aldehyde dehydrogenase [Pimelobacter simplex]MCG8152436.1 aldehyde dehydrogenase family protein [Pimelobacter simplex]GEB14550.1 aldehyde dehydrogenase [Pimelobacter simplex]SFM28344.1 betaine-aldehyde dehydrogenase [Pimelobacter simplex]
MSLTDRPELFIGGTWQAPRGGEVIEVRNPATRALVGRAALASPADVDAAVGAARTSFDSGVWSRATPEERAAVLHRAADHLEKRAADLAVSITSELGCPLWFSEMAHVPNPIRHTRYYADHARTFAYDEVRSDGRNASLVTQEPVGVVAAITPWNGPLSTPSLKIAPALAAGCSVVLKPPPETPLTAYAFADALLEAGLPEGVLSIIPGDREAGAHLVEHADVDKIAFTGSSLAGKQIMATAAQRVARVTLELGGKSAAIVLDDADISAVVPALLPMAMMVNGQACIAQTRVLVPRSRQKELVDALADAMAAQKVGDPMAADTKIGPMVSERQRDRVAGYITIGRQEGARVVTGGETLPLPPELAGGWFVPPTLLADVDNGMRVAQEEIFGPVVAVIAYDDVDDAVRIANDSVYGLSGSVWSSDDGRAVEVARRVRTGMVSINGRPQAYGSPFGGYKQSGIGREMGPEGFAAFLETKSIAVGL